MRNVTRESFLVVTIYSIYDSIEFLLKMASSVRKTTVIGVICLSTGQVGGGSVDRVTMAHAFDF